MNAKSSKYFKPSVVSLQPYTSARDEYNQDANVFLDANENPYLPDYNRYPDPYQKELKKAIGNWRNIDPSKIFLGNGSDEIIDLLIRSTCQAGKDKILTLDPSYGMYRVSSSINEVQLDLAPMEENMNVNEEAILDKLDENYKLIFLCSPNNPNGGLIEDKVVSKILEKTKGLVVIDEAYIDFSNKASWIDRLDNYENLIVLQTFSKSLGAAGIRLGMAFMNEGLIHFLNKIKPPYNISTPNQQIALQRLNEVQKVNLSISKIKEQREILFNALNQLEIVKHIFPSEANFLLIKFRQSKSVFYYLRSVGIIVRDRSKQLNCDGCLRITVGTESENRILLEGLIAINSKLIVPA